MAGMELTTREVADRLGLAIRTVQNWRARNAGPKYVRKDTGKRYEIRYKLRDLLAFEKAYELAKGTRF